MRKVIIVAEIPTNMYHLMKGGANVHPKEDAAPGTLNDMPIFCGTFDGESDVYNVIRVLLECETQKNQRHQNQILFGYHETDPDFYTTLEG